MSGPARPRPAGKDALIADGEIPAASGDGDTRQPAASGQAASDATAVIAGLTAAAQSGWLDGIAALESLSAVRVLAAGLERSELALIEAARDGGVTWSRIAATMGTGNRQTAQKRYADLSRRHPRPPAVDAMSAGTATTAEAIAFTPRPPAVDTASREQKDGQDLQPQQPALTAASRQPAPRPPAASGRPGKSAAAMKKTSIPTITAQIITMGLYRLVKAPDHAETRTWHVLVEDTRVGMVRPTWRGEKSRPGWESIDNNGRVLPATSIGRTTAAGNARTRDAAAVSLLQALRRQQENEYASVVH